MRCFKIFKQSFQTWMYPKTKSLIHISSDAAAFVMSQKREDSGVPSLTEDIYGFCYLLQGYSCFLCWTCAVWLWLCTGVVRLVAEVMSSFLQLSSCLFFLFGSLVFT